MSTFTCQTEGLLVEKGRMTSTRITAIFSVDKYGNSIFSLSDNMREIYISVSGEPLFRWFKGAMNSEYGNEANNLLKQDKRKEQEDEKQEDAGE